MLPSPRTEADAREGGTVRPGGGEAVLHLRKGPGHGVARNVGAVAGAAVARGRGREGGRRHGGAAAAGVVVPVAAEAVGGVARADVADQGVGAGRGGGGECGGRRQGVGRGRGAGDAEGGGGVGRRSCC